MTGFLVEGVRFCVQTFRYWQCSLATQYRWGNTSSSLLTVVCSGARRTGPQTCAFLIPVQDATGLGSSNRSASAYGIPRKDDVLPSRRPRILPALIWTTGGFRFGLPADAAADAALGFSCAN